MYVGAWDELPPLCCAIARTRATSERHIRSPMRRMETSYMEKSRAALQTRCSLQIPDGTTAPLRVKHEVQQHHIDWKQHARTDLGFRETALGNSSYTPETITINKTIFHHHQPHYNTCVRVCVKSSCCISMETWFFMMSMSDSTSKWLLRDDRS
jgi:antibiotic biosynthesis monooxygenase (ABM) superfamily enzyme